VEEAGIFGGATLKGKLPIRVVSDGALKKKGRKGIERRVLLLNLYVLVGGKAQARPQKERCSATT